MNPLFNINLNKTPSWVAIENVFVPKGVIGLIFSYLTVKELQRSAATCKSFLKCILQNEVLLKKIQSSLKEFKTVNKNFRKSFELKTIVLNDKGATRGFKLVNSHQLLVKKIKYFYGCLFNECPLDLLSAMLGKKTIKIHSTEFPFCDHIEITTTVKDKNSAKTIEKKPQIFHLVLLSKESFLNSENPKMIAIPNPTNWIKFNSQSGNLTIHNNRENPITLVNETTTTKTKEISITIQSFLDKEDVLLPEDLIYTIGSIVTTTILKNIGNYEKEAEKKCIIM